MNLTSALCAAGARVRILARFWPAESQLRANQFLANVEFHHGDMRDEAVVERAVDGCEFVFHLAGKSGPVASNESPLEDLDVNCRGFLVLLSALRHRTVAAKVVFPSSRLVYAPVSMQPVPETATIGPLSIYGIHKLTAEHYLHIFGREFGVRGTVLRLTNPYGPFQSSKQNRYGIINWFIHRAVAGHPIEVFGSGQQLRDYIHVQDVVSAMLIAGASSEADGGTFNIGTGEGTSVAELANLVVQVAGTGSVRYVEWPQAQARVETGDFLADSTLFKTTCGWTPRIALEDGIRDVVEHYLKTASEL